MPKSESKVYYIKVLLDTIQAYQLANKPQNLGDILFHIVNRITIPGYNKEPSDPMDLLYYAKTLEAVDEGLEAYRKMVAGGGKGGTTTAQRNAERKERNAAERKEQNAAEPVVAASVAPSAPVKSAPVRKVSQNEMMRNFASVNYGEIENDTLNAIGQMLGAQFDAKTKSAIAKLIREKGKANVAQEVCAIRGEWDADELNTINNPAAYVISRLKKL